MKRISLPFLFLISSIIEVHVQAADREAVVIEVRKNVSLAKSEKVYKNYFINGGENLGLKKGIRVDVLRRLPLHDPLKNISVGDLRVKVAEMEIIHSEGSLSVAKLISQETNETRPLLDYDAVMIGDRLDLTSLREPKKQEKSVADNELAEAQKVALLQRSDKAKNLIKEGEQNLGKLANLQSTDVAKKTTEGRKVASISNGKKGSSPKKPALKKKK